MMVVECIWMGIGAACLYIAEKRWKRALLFFAFPLPVMFFTMLTPAVVTVADYYPIGTNEEQVNRFVRGESRKLYGVDVYR